MKSPSLLPRAVLLLLILTLLLAALPLTQAQQPVFRIGIIDTERGPIVSGARLAVMQINAAGGVVGADGTAFLLELVVQPPDDMAAAVANINQASVIAVIGPERDNDVLSNLPLLQALNVPVLTPAQDDTILARDVTDRVYRIRAPQLLQGRSLAHYIVTDLGFNRFVTVQLDIESTIGVIGFTTAMAEQGVQPLASLLADPNIPLSQLALQAVQASPQLIAIYGPPKEAAELYTALLQSGWSGRVAYSRATLPEFRDAVNLEDLTGVLSTSSWPYSASDEVSTEFLLSYVRVIGAVPGPVEAASYDAVHLLAEAIPLPGTLENNLQNLTDIRGVQGLLSPARLTRGETSANVAVIELGPFGSPLVLGRYYGGQRLPDEDPDLLIATVTPTPTATPEGVVITIQSAVQNVRTGPSTDYDILGQMTRGETARVIGATVDLRWVVIEYRGQQGWLLAELLDIFGNTATVPVLTPPPTPTPGPTSTPPPLADIIIVAASPGRLPTGSPFSVNVTVMNQGLRDAGPFAIGATFPPDNVYTAVNILGGLQAGQQTVVTLSGTFTTSSTGPQSVVIVADLNNEVDEGPAGEANNTDFVFSFMRDRTILNASTLTLNPGGSLTLEGAGPIDIQWNATGTSLDAQNGAGMYIMTGISSIEQVHYDMIDTTLTTTTNLNVALLPNTVIAIRTAEGNRGVMQVIGVASGGPITLVYRVYSP